MRTATFLSFQSPAVQWMAPTSSLNCLSCRYPYQTPHSLNYLPPFHWKIPLFHTQIGAKNWTQTFFSQTFRALPGYPGKIPGYPAKKSVIPWVSRDMPNFLAPTPSRGRPPPHPKISGPKSLGLGSFFVPDEKCFVASPSQKSAQNLAVSLGETSISEFLSLCFWVPLEGRDRNLSILRPSGITKTKGISLRKWHTKQKIWRTNPHPKDPAVLKTL